MKTVIITLFLGCLSWADGPTSVGKANINLLTDSKQMTLYTFDLDAANQSKCEGDCLVEWPPFLVADPSKKSLEGSDLGTFARADGRLQYSFKGKPLYYFDEDKNPGDALGSEDDGIWHVILQAAPTPPPPPTPVFSLVSGCKAEDYVEGNAESAISFAGMGYSPKCLKIHVGSKVTIAGSPVHPLQGMAPIDGVANPFQSGGDAQKTAVTKVLDKPGFYGYFCVRHGTADGNGMAGAIQVIP